jgi:hypothetical protein
MFLGLSLGAPQFYSSMAFISDAHSVRGEIDFEYATSWSMHFAEMMSLWVPEYGNWYQYYWGENHFKLNTEYIGAVATLLAILAFVFKQNKWRYFWLAMAVLSLLFSLAASSPGIRFGEKLQDVISIYTIGYYLVPGVDKFRAVSMITFIASFAVVLLSVLSLRDIWNEEWKNFSSQRLKNTKLGLLISLVVITGISLLFADKGFNYSLSSAFTPGLEGKRHIWEANFDRNFGGALAAWWVISAIVLASVWAVISGYLKKETAIVIFFVLGMIDVLRVNTQFIKFESNARYRNIPPAVSEVLRKTRNEPARSLLFPEVTRAWNENIESFWGLEGVNGFQDNELVRYREFRGRGGVNYLMPIYVRANMGYSDPISDGGNALNLANCRYIFYVTQTGQLAYIENKNAMPRLSFTDNYIVETDREIISQTINNPDFAVHKTAILEQQPSFESSPFATTDISTKWVKYTPNYRIAEVEVKKPGLLRISEVYYPAWIVLVNGKKARILNSDLAFMAVEIPAGTHKIEMKIDSLYLRTGILLSIPAYIFLLTVLVLTLQKRARKKE